MTTEPFDSSADWVKLLRDPETKEELTLATDAHLEALRRAITDGRARRNDGGELPKAFEAAFLSSGGSRAYLVIDGIPNFLIEERIELESPIETKSPTETGA